MIFSRLGGTESSGMYSSTISIISTLSPRQTGSSSSGSWLPNARGVGTHSESSGHSFGKLSIDFRFLRLRLAADTALPGRDPPPLPPECGRDEVDSALPGRESPGLPALPPDPGRSPSLPPLVGRIPAERCRTCSGEIGPDRDPGRELLPPLVGRAAAEPGRTVSVEAGPERELGLEYEAEVGRVAPEVGRELARLLIVAAASPTPPNTRERVSVRAV